MSLANYCLSLVQRKDKILQPKTRSGSRIWRYGERILSDVAINPEDKPDWYVEYDRIVRRCYGAGGAGGVLAPDWHKASAFRDWWEGQEDPTEDFVITWNIVVPTGELFEFSPATGFFFPEAVKKFFMPPIVRVGELGWSGMLGVGRRLHMNNSYSSRGVKVGGRGTMTYHATELEAHLAWLKVKAMELSVLVETEKRELGKEILQARLTRLLLAIDARQEVKFL